ncbi:hypothetical protein [Gordonia bronchialis]|uniref:hypothetical protein n=1 Tax=Gordonia bronchialis TaxID=2054 RepID=UPI00226DCEF1|nr:hypothetical protein [Gordonia bronchialis]
MKQTRLLVDRLTPDDDLFVRMDLVLDLPVANQFVWRLPARVDPETLRALARRLKRGRLSRLVVRQPSPCRDVWAHTESAGDFEFDDVPIGSGEATEWARRQADADLDILGGPAWRLSAGYSVDGTTTYVSLVNSHAVGDGGAMIAAVVEAVRDERFERAPGKVGMIDNMRDAAISLVAAGGAVKRLLHGSSPSMSATTGAQDPRTTGASASTVDTAEPSPTVMMLVPAGEFRQTAEETGGTLNSLFAAIMVGLVERTGRVKSGQVVPVNLPVSLRTARDRRANATAAARAFITLEETRYTDLSAVRQACKDAYVQLSPRSGHVAQLTILGQALNDFTFGKLAANAQTPLCLASNVGQVPDEFASLGTGISAFVAARAITTTSDPRLLAARQGGLSGWLSLAGGMATLSVTSLDPARVPDSTMLSTLLADELARWGLTAHSWES